MAEQKNKKQGNFKIDQLGEDALQVYTDTIDAKQKIGSTSGFGASFQTLGDQDSILTQLQGADKSGTRNTIIRASRMLYAMNPIYARIINYYATMFLPRYYATPRFSPFIGKQKLKGQDWQAVYNQMVELVDGLNLDTKLIQLLTYIFVEGGVYLTSFYSEENQAIDFIVLPSEYCQRVGETIVGTDVIQFDFSYFDSLGLDKEELEELFTGFPKEFADKYVEYKADNKKRWTVLDPRHSSSILLNQKAIPTAFYSFIGITNFQDYMRNELDKNTQALQTIVEHHIPTYQDKLLLETPEMNLLHKKLSSIVRTAKHTRLVTTIGDVKIHQLLDDSSTVADKTLENAYKSIYDTAGLNNGLFYGDNQYSTEASMSIDRGYVWHLIEKLTNFYNVVINNCGIDFKGYQLELTMMPISRDKTTSDIAVYRENAKVGVGVLPFMIASGMKQKNIDSLLDMETNLDLVARLVPLRSSNTMASDYDKDQPSTTNEDEENGSN